MKARTRNSAAISLATSVFGLTTAVRDLRTARRDGDRLALADAIFSLAAVVTGVAIAYRTIRDGSE